MDEPPILLEAGPATIRRIGAPAPAGSDALGALAALCALDDPVALVEGTPVGVDELLRTAVAAALNPPCGPVTVVHPSWWPRTRVERVVAAVAATTAVTAVTAALPRCAVIRRRYGSAAVLEIAAGVVAVSGHAGLRLLDWRDADAIADSVADVARGTPVLIDAPDALPGAAQRAEMIRKQLSDRKIRSRIVECAPPPARGADSPPHAPASRRWIPVAALAAVVAAAAVAGVVLRPDPVRTAGPSILAEGRVTVEIPPDWTVRRVTGGPGSRRVEVRSPDDTAVLHITSAYAPQTTLADAAEVLGRAVAAEPAGVFTGLRTAEFAGRPALGYREIRPGRVVSWWVMMDRSTRIAIGCQSAPRREESVGAACLAAVASAREGNRSGPHSVQ